MIDERAVLRLALELDRQAEPISGRLCLSDGTNSEFVGWLELTQALEAARLSATETLEPTD